MASPRSSTPASRGSSPELLMTPRSKIKALLATVESSDDENTTQNNITKKTSPSPSPSHNNDTTSSQHNGDSDSDIDVRPRGKLASRMRGVGAEPTTQMEVDEVEEAQTSVISNTNDGVEAGQLTVAPRRLKRRAPKATSPGVDSTSRSPSPGLFVSSPIRPSPSKVNTETNNDSESDNDLPPVKSDRFKALVERKRQERLAREAADDARRAGRQEQQEKLASELAELDSDGNDSSITDDEGGRNLTQQARPTRKAGKKAIEEMSRETQRMARNMQLAHEAKTRKKITTASLFERFNFKPPGGAHLLLAPQANSSSRQSTPLTDADIKDAATPPSSPPASAKKNNGQGDGVDVQMAVTSDDDLPSLEDVTNSSPLKLDKSKAPIISVDEPEVLAPQVKRRVRVILPVPTVNLARVDSDDDLEVTTTTKDKINAMFDSIPCKRAQESQSMQALRALAHVRSPGKEQRHKDEPVGMTRGELQASLYQKARQQAKLERDRRIDMLKAQGAVIETAEERERNRQDVEDILAKAREEGQKIMEEERAAAKKERKENGEVDPLAWDDSDDEEYEEGADDADGEVSAVELSGSEEEDDDDEEGDDETEAVAGAALFETEAEDAESEDGLNDQNEAESDGEDVGTPIVNRRRARKQMAVLSDDEADAAVEATPKPKSTTQMTPGRPAMVSPVAPTSVLRSAKKNFIPGLPVHGAAGLGLTQIFAGTMDDSQMSATNGPTQSMMPDFDAFPDSNFSATMEEPVDVIMDTQRDETQRTTQGVQLHMSQTQMHGLDSLLRDSPYTQMSEIVEPSQDGGLQEHTPLKQRFVDPPFSTIETVPVDQPEDGPQDSPLVRKGRLRRRMDMSQGIDNSTVPVSPVKRGVVGDAEAFTLLKDGAEQVKRKEEVNDFNRKKSKAKEMVQEQAEESEDEYAGLGGADGEDSDNDSDGSMQEMIDDATANNADGRKLAAFYADRERANDEKDIEKLYKDITTGMLRRKRGADYDLSDSDDGGEARRRMKRRQFAKMQKALFGDERVKKMAENPGNQAFLRTIEDRGSDDDMDFLNIAEAPSVLAEDTQSQPQEEIGQNQGQTIPDSQPRRPLATAGENRAPAHARRTRDGKKPSNIGEVRETLSDLLEDQHGSVIPATEIGSDSDEEARPATGRSDKENRSPNPRRRQTAVVDRISLKRNASSTTANTSRLAFASNGASSTFKVPALLRRATTNSSLVSGSTASSSSNHNNNGASSTNLSSTSMGSGFGDEAKIKKGAGKKSGVNGFARDVDRRARMQESERRRQEKKVRGAEMRVGVVGGLLGKGSFE